MQLLNRLPKANGKPKAAKKKTTKKAAKKVVSKSVCGDDCACSAPTADNGNGCAEFIRKFWNKNYRAVDMLLSPKPCTPPEEVVAMVNEALQYAYDHFNK